jgi:hypothetical protein
MISGEYLKMGLLFLDRGQGGIIPAVKNLAGGETNRSRRATRAARRDK